LVGVFAFLVGGLQFLTGGVALAMQVLGNTTRRSRICGRVGSQQRRHRNLTFRLVDGGLGRGGCGSWPAAQPCPLTRRRRR
jgi:hypothetical protein